MQHGFDNILGSVPMGHPVSCSPRKTCPKGKLQGAVSLESDLIQEHSIAQLPSLCGHFPSLQGTICDVLCEIQLWMGMDSRESKVSSGSNWHYRERPHAKDTSNAEKS